MEPDKRIRLPWRRPRAGTPGRMALADPYAQALTVARRLHAARDAAPATGWWYR